MNKKTPPVSGFGGGYLFQNKVVVEYSNVLFTHLVQHPSIHQQVLSEIYKVNKTKQNKTYHTSHFF